MNSENLITILDEIVEDTVSNIIPGDETFDIFFEDDSFQIEGKGTIRGEWDESYILCPKVSISELSIIPAEGYEEVCKSGIDKFRKTLSFLIADQLMII